MIRRSIVIAGALAASAALLLPQKVDEDVILRAMRDELEHSRELRVVGGGDDVPYYINYSLSDGESFRVSASLGALISTSRSRFRAPVIDVRCGSYDFDNTGHIFSGYYTGSRYDNGAWPIDDSYPQLRNALWLGTDRAYKTALESMARKRASLNNAAAGTTEKLPDFSRSEPVKSIGKVSRRKLDEAAWISRVTKLSSVFKGIPEVIASNVEFQFLNGGSYMMDTEGTTLRYQDDVVMTISKAEGQAPDGMTVHDAAMIQALELDQYPSDAVARAIAMKVAENVKALAHAPAGESFSGPVLFEPEAAAQLLAQLIGDNVRLPRRPLTDPGRNTGYLASEFETKVGSRILPDWIDIVDDPTLTTFQGKPLAGYYPFDLEGVVPKRVTLVEKGVFKNFLTTRQPVKGFPTSNGHARLSGGFGAHSAAISNLFIKANQTQSLASLRQKLIDSCKERGKPYGMIVRKLDYPYSSGRTQLQLLAQAGQQSGGSVRPISPPVLLYRVYPDGHEELVRGLRFRGMSTRVLRDLLAASSETGTFEFVNNAAPLAMLDAGGYLAPASIVSPALLFEEIEFERPQDQLPKLPIVPAPTATR